MNDLLISPQKTIAKLFGYQYTPIKTPKKVTFITQNTTYQCKSCGIVQDEGYYDKTHVLISSKSNHLYSFKEPSSPFYCSYCNFIQLNYQKKFQKMPLNDIADIVVYKNHFEQMEFKTESTKNDLYFLLTSPPEPPFIIMLKDQKSITSIVNMSHTVKPTIDKNLFVINYGLSQHMVIRNTIFKCLNDYSKLKMTFNNSDHKLSDEVLFNRNKNTKYTLWLSTNLLQNNDFVNEYRNFINKYNESTRFVAKIILKTFLTQKDTHNGNI